MNRPGENPAARGGAVQTEPLAFNAIFNLAAAVINGLVA